MQKQSKPSSQNKVILEDEALESHLAQTEKQINRMEIVFESIDKKPTAKKCKAKEELIK